jgi:hypothetical protein
VHEFGKFQIYHVFSLQKKLSLRDPTENFYFRPYGEKDVLILAAIEAAGGEAVTL